MQRDYQFFLRRYEQIEDDFIEITHFVEPKEDFEHACYQVGSSKLMDFCMKVGTEVETLFREIMKHDRFDGVPGIEKAREHQSIDVYRGFVEPAYRFRDFSLLVLSLRREITPFEQFDVTGYPEWFSVYSKYKHDKLELIDRWTLRHCLYALGCLLLLVINHPSVEGQTFRRHQVSARVFDLLGSTPRFCPIVISVKS